MKRTWPTDDVLPLASASASALARERRRLPIWEARQALLAAVAASPTRVLTGETGCGKTTQIPQFLLAAGYAERGIIGITQPRRVAAMSVAKRVSEEMGVELGSRVGYSVRFDDCSSSETRLRYLTDGMLLREAIADPLLRRYAIVIVDEAHERSLQTDMMLAILKRAQAARAAPAAAPATGASGKKQPKLPPLRLLVMSATLETATFCRYFGGAPAVQVLGRTHPVQMLYVSADQTVTDYLEAAATTVLQIHHEERPGDVLVFLTGQDDIEAVGAAIKRRLPANATTNHKQDAASGVKATAASGVKATAEPLVVLPLYAALPPSLQLKALRPARPGTRKVILATNIAETSVTIDGVVFVVDCGYAKVRTYHPGKRVDSLLATPISKAAARQRAGRAGRQEPGKCYRLYSESTFHSLTESSTPEIQRISLAGALLALKALGVEDVLSFDFVSPPSTDALAAALEQLLALGALQRDGTLSADGRWMAQLPLDPAYAKALLESGAARHDCLPTMLTLIAMLSADGAPFLSGPSTRAAADEARLRFVSPQADTLTLVHVFDAFGGRSGGTAKAWCEQHHANRRTLEAARLVRTQLRESCERLGLVTERDRDLEVTAAAEAAADTGGSAPPQLDIERSRRVRRALTAAFFMHAALRQPTGEYLALVSREHVAVHPSSVLFLRKVR